MCRTCLASRGDNVFFVDPLTVESVSKIEVDVGHHTVNVTRVPLGSNDMEFALIIRDITYRRSQEKELVLKSVAIKEMHHRVKTTSRRSQASCDCKCGGQRALKQGSCWRRA